MRIMGFTEKWGKLGQDVFTTWRLPRKDAPKGQDWHIGECVQCFYRPRSPNKEYLCIAMIIGKEERILGSVTEEEAITDGFSSRQTMLRWMWKAHPHIINPTVNKLTLKRLTERVEAT